MPTVDIDAGVIHYETVGPPTGRPVVFVHGYLMGSSLWRQISERLGARGLRCIAPTWPLGAHPEPMRPGTDMTLPGIAAMVDALLRALDLDDVVLVGNDTGGVVSQLVAIDHPERIGALVLTSCDAFEHFPPPILKPLIVAAKLRATFRLALQPLRTPVGRQKAYAVLSHRDINDLAVEWLKPALGNGAIADDLRRLTASLRQQTTLDAAARLGEFTKPALIAWSADDGVFPLEDGPRLAAALPDARLRIIDDARTFSMLDQPDRLAALIAEIADPVGDSQRSAEQR